MQEFKKYSSSLSVVDVTIHSVSNVKLLSVNINVELNLNLHIALLCNKASRQINALSRLSNVLNVDTKILILQSFILSHFMYCYIIWHFCSISDTKKIEKIQLKALRHIYKDYTYLYEMLRENCNRPMFLIERQKTMLLEVYKCVHELGHRYRHDMFSQKSRAYDYRNPSILTVYMIVIFCDRCVNKHIIVLSSISTIVLFLS